MEEKRKTYRERSSFLPFDPLVIAVDVMKRWFVIALAAVTVGMVSWGLNAARIEPVYESVAVLAVTAGEETSAGVSGVGSAAAFAREFADLVNSSLAWKLVLEDAGMGDFEGTVGAQALAETNLVTIRVTAYESDAAHLAAAAMAEHHDPVTSQVLGHMTAVILKPPEIPVSPLPSPDPAVLAVRNGCLAAVLTVLLLAFLSADRDAVRSSGEADRKLNCSCLGEIPHGKMRESLLLSDPGTPARYTEEIRKLRRRVEQKMDGGKVLMVTSFLEKEGKTTVAVNIALAMARKKDKVLLVDMDLQNPGCEFFLKGKEGVDLLTVKKEDALCADWLASGSLERLLNWAKEHHDFIVLDVGPMSQRADAEQAADYADGTLLVVRQNAARTPELNRAVALLQKGKAKLLGCVINDVYGLPRNGAAENRRAALSGQKRDYALSHRKGG